MESFDPAELPELLKLYYRRLFPYAQYYRWLNYGGVVKNYFQHREFSFTLKDDIYIRYQSFNNQSDLEKEMQKMNPYKIDIGAVYSHRPNLHNTVKLGAFQAQEKELVFDIDMTDYDDVRRCCSSADICSKCWTLMTMAIRVIDRALKEDFGFKHRLWVYSGRRGVHCWVCDESVRKLSSAVRSGIVEYLSLVKGGQDVKKKVHLSEKIHPFVRRSINIIKKYFEEYALVGQDILENKESWDKILALLPENILYKTFKSHSSLQRWEQLKKTISTSQVYSIEIKSLQESWLCVHALLSTNMLIMMLMLGHSDYKKTSLAPYVKVFEQFLENLDKSRKGELLKKSDLQKDF
uniref:DNA primase n=1 Tax=Jaculus jaculus TaxID=51337 RepID=A0A8C5KUF8_JACJA